MMGTRGGHTHRDFEVTAMMNRLMEERRNVEEDLPTPAPHMDVKNGRKQIFDTNCLPPPQKVVRCCREPASSVPPLT